MELDDLKTIWLKEKMELESKIILNHNLVKELILNKSKNSFDRLISISILGRNLALVYMLMSLFLASKVLYELQYTCKPTNHSKYIYWKGLIFMELSEEIIKFYQSHDIELPSFENKIQKYSQCEKFTS